MYTPVRRLADCLTFLPVFIKKTAFSGRPTIVMRGHGLPLNFLLQINSTLPIGATSKLTATAIYSDVL